MRKTKIVCTIGPASDSEEMLKKMMLAGMDVARLNFSHGTHEEHKVKIDRIKKLRKELNLPVAILLDTKGIEIRTKTLEGGSAELVAGEEFIFTTEEIVGNNKRVSVTYPNLPRCLKKDNTILVDDGLCELRVKEITDTDIICEIINGGILGDHKSMNMPGVKIDIPYLSEADKSDIIFGIENDVDFFALSFVRSAHDVRDVRHLLNSRGCYNIEIIAKIENREGVDNIDEIINHSNGIMVARGDMGVEIPFEELPYIQKKIITACYSAGKKVITATQMLESMIKNPRPTRAEITDVANAIYDGTSAIMLSGETAMGKYPIRAIETMVKIAIKTEATIDYGAKMAAEYTLSALDVNITNAISYSTCATAHNLNAKVIVAVTLSGNSARMISRFRPQIPIIAVTPFEKTYYQLALSWGVTPLKNEYIEDSQELIDDAAILVKKEKYVENGDMLIIAGSTQYSAGAINSIQVHIVGDILIKGVGVGDNDTSGRVCVINDDRDISSFLTGDIIVTRHTTTEVLQLMRHCSAIITEEIGGETGAAAAAAALALDIPAVTDAVNAASILKTGVKVRIDIKNGYIYNTDKSLM